MAINSRMEAYLTAIGIDESVELPRPQSRAEWLLKKIYEKITGITPGSGGDCGCDEKIIVATDDEVTRMLDDVFGKG